MTDQQEPTHPHNNSYTRTRWIALYLLATVMIAIGVLHFTSPDGFIAIVPKVLPARRFLVYLSGVIEIALGVGLLIPSIRVWVGWGLILLFIAVFPANINMAVNHINLPGTNLPWWGAWVRLPFQFVFMAWAWWVTQRQR